MISAQTDQVQQERLIEKYMALPDQVWDSIINQATQVSIVITISKINSRLMGCVKVHTCTCTCTCNKLNTNTMFVYSYEIDIQLNVMFFRMLRS